MEIRSALSMLTTPVELVAPAGIMLPAELGPPPPAEATLVDPNCRPRTFGAIAKNNTKGHASTTVYSFWVVEGVNVNEEEAEARSQSNI